jgi:hypothetical protein
MQVTNLVKVAMICDRLREVGADTEADWLAKTWSDTHQVLRYMGALAGPEWCCPECKRSRPYHNSQCAVQSAIWNLLTFADNKMIPR